MHFADLHCHNHQRTYLWMKSSEGHHRQRDEYNPWTIISPNLRAQRKAVGSAAPYGQSDLVKLWNGRVRLVFNSLYSIERGFFQTGSKAAGGKNRLPREVVRLVTSHHGPLRDVLQMFYMRIPDGMIDFLQSDRYDYWQWLQHEYNFAVSKSGQRVNNKIISPGLLRKIFENRENRRNLYPDSLDATGIYSVPKSRAELNATLARDEITMVLTMEGAHCFGSDAVEYTVLGNRLMAMKTDRSRFPYPIFFITYAHHFDNYLCGHAKSLPDLGKWFLNQDARMNAGFTALGRKFIRKILGLSPHEGPLKSNNEVDTNSGPRILIDIKHMSARARAEYYQLVEDRLQQGDVIPVIASHCGYSGIGTLTQLVENEASEKDEYFDPSGEFNAWNINVSDEDIKIIFKTRGLFGLSFDQRIVGVPKKQKKTGGDNSIRALWNNLKAVLNVIYTDASIPAVEKPDAWNILSLGTDNEGFIDPINDYTTALKFEAFRADLIAVIDAQRQHSRPTLCVRDFVSQADVVQAVDKLCFGNARTFVLNNYPT